MEDYRGEADIAADLVVDFGMKNNSSPDTLICAAN